VSKRRRPAASRRLAEQRFWGRADNESEPVKIRPTGDPAAVVRSLGAPPLPLDPSLVERHLAAVYEEAVRAATALAAANGLLAEDEDPG
jgi:hypothetical protein